MKVRQYRPACFTGFENEEAEANTLEELVEIPWVARWMRDEGFYRLSVSCNTLMAEMDGGRHWYVIAFLDGSTDFGLPQRTTMEERNEK